MGSVASMPTVPSMTEKIESIMDALTTAYETEVELMKQYQEFYEQAEDDYGDCVTATFIQQFLLIQSKSVGQYGDLISRLNQNPTDVFQFDHFMKKQ